MLRVICILHGLLTRLLDAESWVTSMSVVWLVMWGIADFSSVDHMQSDKLQKQLCRCGLVSEFEAKSEAS